ncbi:MAG: site-specific integrase [Muribaculaceae bacterium]|nr:site-specific integrase [Muribaculaceae bacterium]
MPIRFYLDNRLDKKGDAPIRMSVSIRGCRFISSIGLKIAPRAWDTEKQRVKKGYNNADGITWAVINSTILKINSCYAEYENDCITTNHNPTKENLKEVYAKHFTKKKRDVAASKQEATITFYDLFDEFTRERGATNNWTKSTFQKFAALKNHLLEFNPSLSFDILNDQGLSSLLAFFRDELQMKNSTIGKQWGFFKWFMRWATLKGYNTNTAYQSYTPKLKTTSKKVIFLEWEELMRVYNFNVPANGTELILHNASGKSYTKIVSDAPAIEKTRDIFCLCAFTSMRYSDAINLKRVNVDDTAITFTTIKTADTLTIELNKYSKAILNKYKDCDFGEYAMPRITNQRMNIYLKELCEMCEINQPVTQTYYRGSERYDETHPKFELMGTHAGRRTFICNALMLGIPAETVMKWTGHSDYKSMKPYIDIANSAKAKAMALFDNLE